MIKNAVILWEGPIDNIIKSVIHESLKIFDYVYYITDNKNNYSSDRIIPLDYSKFQDYMRNKNPRYALGSWNLADILCYKALEILKEIYNIELDRVMKIDPDLILYNRFLVEEVYENCNTFMAMRDQCIRRYPENPYYRNVALSIDNKNRTDSDLIMTIRQVLGFRLTQDMVMLKYDYLGPNLIDGYDRDFIKYPYGTVSCLSLHPGELTKGTIKIKLDKNYIGLHLTNSEVKRYGFKINDVRLVNGYIELDVDDLK